MNIDKIAKAIEADAGESIDGLRESLAEMQVGKVARETTPDQLLLRDPQQRTLAAFSHYLPTGLNPMSPIVLSL